MQYAFEFVDGLDPTDAFDRTTQLVVRMRGEFVAKAAVADFRKQRVASDRGRLYDAVFDAFDAPHWDDDSTPWDRDPQASLKACRRLLQLGAKSRSGEEYGAVPELWAHWNLYAIEHFRSVKWKGLESEVEFAEQLARRDAMLASVSIPLYLLAGKEERFRDYCRSLLTNPDYTTQSASSIPFDEIEPEFEAAMLRMATLDPEGLDQPEELLERVKAAKQSSSREYNLVLHRSLIRAGRYDDAIGRLKEKLEVEDMRPGDLILLQLHLAIAHLHAGKQSEGADYYQQALETRKQVDLSEIGAFERIEIFVISAEAEKLLKQESVP